MKKFLFFLSFFFYYFIFFFSQAEENFTGLKSCSYDISEKSISEYENKEIKYAKIEVDNYRKWSKNNVKILLTSGRYIPEKYKKKFKSTFTIVYGDGSKCSFKSKIRQSGDEKDHIEIKENSVIQSLDVQLIDGNIRGITKFKLFKPKTRGNHEDEIIQTQLLRNLGYLAPRTINIKLQFNGIESNMLMQEKAEKELLEFNNRREGPILEGDEKFFWEIVKDIPDDNKSNWDVGIPNLLNKSSKVMLSKSTNANLILRGEQHMNMFFNAIENLNYIFLYWGSRFQGGLNNFYYFDYDLENKLLSNNNEEIETKLEMYNLLMQATNSQHGLAASNRKFYWNSMGNYFEPINYDSNPNINLVINNYNVRLPISKNYLNSIQTLSDLLKKTNTSILHEQINKSGIEITKIDVEKKIEKIIANLDIIKKSYLNFNNDEYISKNYYTEIKNIYYNFSNTLEEINPKTAIIKKDRSSNSFIKCNIFLIECDEVVIREKDIVKLLEGELKTEGIIYQYGDNNNTLNANEQKKYKLKKFFNSNIFYENGIEVVISEENNKIEIFQKKIGAKIYITNGSLVGTKINFQGVNIDKFINDNKNYQPFNFPINSDGFTGCLTLTNLKLENIYIFADNSSCEDSVNLINTSGSLAEVKIINAFSDALDVDFSNLKINYIEIEKAGNDCSDFSGGDYRLKYLKLDNCKDKGVSVGEKSKVFIDNLNVKNVSLGVASKDSSITKIKKSKLENVETCLASYNKKMEFIGSVLEASDFNCINYSSLIENDKISKILIKN